MIALLLSIEGRVQGVGYRDWLLRQAEQREVRGWVRNRPDGSVQALVAGDPAAVRAVVEACRLGPMFAKVSRISEMPATPPDVAGFSRQPDG